MATNWFRATLDAISWSLNQLQHELPLDQFEEFLSLLQKAYSLNHRVFVYGLGRSLLIGKAFSMRLMHMGFHSYVIGETVTPAVGAHDVFVVISKTLSGKSVSAAIGVAHHLQAQIVIVTAKQAHDLLQKAATAIIIPDLKTSTMRTQETTLPLGTLFEVLTLVLLDCVVAELMHQLTIPEAAMATRHANIQE